jgi:hypothetical protein
VRLQGGDRGWHTDLFVELDRTFKPSKNIDKFERYDHMLAGWSLHKDRYTKYLPDAAIVVFICRDQSSVGSSATPSLRGHPTSAWPGPMVTRKPARAIRVSGKSWHRAAARGFTRRAEESASMAKRAGLERAVRHRASRAF